MPAPKPPPDQVIQFDRERVHIVKCPNCGRTVGEMLPVPGAMNRYRCHSCREWTWLMVIGATLTGGAAAGTMKPVEPVST